MARAVRPGIRSCEAFSYAAKWFQKRPGEKRVVWLRKNRDPACGSMLRDELELQRGSVVAEQNAAGKGSEPVPGMQIPAMVRKHVAGKLFKGYPRLP